MNGSIAVSVDVLWVLVAAVLVFFMQGGFLLLEGGSVRERSAPIVAMKNVVDWAVACVTFFFFGWALMFGHSIGGIFGGDFFALSGNTKGGWVGGIGPFFLFQLAFAGTAATIVSGAIAERAGFVAYMCATFAITGIIYPIFGHWAWGNLFFSGNETFLTNLGFIDFAGSSVVHL